VRNSVNYGLDFKSDETNMTAISNFKARKKSADDAHTPLVCLTAYTTPMARSIAGHVDLILVGDSLGMVLYGMDSTQGVTIDMMIAHGKAVMRAGADVPVIVDMPHGSYEGSDGLALASARRIMAETGADGVKLEGGAAMAGRVAAITADGIAVMGHIGLLPQSAPDEGGFKIKGKDEAQILNLIKDGQAVEAAGAFAFVIEGTREDAAARVSAAVGIPTIGIGASGACDGQILVTEDLIGALDGHRPKFAPEYASLRGVIDDAVGRFAADIRSGAFPRDENLYKKKA
jgi:3-methyl-2-oxobutanoate hydroxymethyltransferase